MSTTNGEAVTLPETIEWATNAVGQPAHLVSAERLVGIPGSDNPPWLLRFRTASGDVEVVLRTEAIGQVRHVGFAREVQALTAAEGHGLAAPRVIAADLDGAVAGHPAFLVTVVPGVNWQIAWRRPGDGSDQPMPSTEALHSYGSAVASLRSVRLSPTQDLALLTSPIDADEAAFERRRVMAYEAASAQEKESMLAELCAERGCGRDQAIHTITTPAAGRSEALEAAEQRIGRLPVPGGDTVLVHGDLHPGNTLWIGDRLTGIVDWDAAGVGPDGIDLGLARLLAALRFGPPAAIEVLAGWRDASGTALEPEVVAYWDARAALNRSPGLAGTPVDVYHAFLKSAMNALPDA